MTQTLAPCETKIPLHEEIIRLCISFRQNYPIKLPDAIIAATALHAKVPLMTRNMTDFERVPELKMVDPFSQIINQ
ncbi:MAG: type II toxin-antitoxin system VapC family toxin [Euryarchaeota archaeon]